MAPQSRDSYHPSERGVHSKDEMRGGEGSICWGRDEGGVGVEMSVRMVCKGSVGSQESIYKKLETNGHRLEMQKIAYPLRRWFKGRRWSDDVRGLRIETCSAILAKE
jgi:hypothetical protein